MRKFSSNAVTVAKWSVLSLVAAAALVACGGGSTTAVPDKVAASDVSVPVTAATVAALIAPTGSPAITATFANGFSGVNAQGAEVSITGSTGVSFGGTAAAPTASITNGGKTVSAEVVFGSCSFKITSHEFDVSNPSFGFGAVFKVDPCSVGVATAGAVANGTTAPRTVTYTFGKSTATAPNQIISIATDGTVNMNGFKITTTTVTAVSGS